MSYSGFYEYICKEGHYFAVDVEAAHHIKVCPHCEGKFKYFHSVDQTNGYGENEKWLKQGEDETISPEDFHRIIYSDQRAPKVQVGFEDIEHTDKYGTVYYTEIKLYAPDNDSVWKEL